MEQDDEAFSFFFNSLTLNLHNLAIHTRTKSLVPLNLIILIDFVSLREEGCEYASKGEKKKKNSRKTIKTL